MRTKAILLLLLAAVAASAVCLLWFRPETEHPVARITRDGALVEEVDLSQVEEPYTLVLKDGSGLNTVLVEPGRIRISEADCPDQICVNQGYISDSTVPIVCLPHRLMVEIVGARSELDGGAG